MPDLSCDERSLLVITEPARIRALAPMPRLIAALREAFREEPSWLPRQQIDVPGENDRLMLVMPAIRPDGSGVVKLATVFPGNAGRSLATVQALVVVFSKSGSPAAVLDGTVLTRLRTSAASALASTYLSRPDSAHLLIIGTGALAPYMAEAHSAVRPITVVSVWGRNRERADAAAADIRRCLGSEVLVQVSDVLEDAVGAADIVSCVTSSATPVLLGRYLRPGTFVDLVGSFSPSKREADDDAVRCARLFVDTYEGALGEAGDLLVPIARGIVSVDDVEAELAELVDGRHAGRSGRGEITLFKSVGTALEDLAAARLIIDAATDGTGIA